MKTPKPGAIVHAELTSDDPPATRKFMTSVFGWKFKKEEMGEGMEYWTFDTGTAPAGGLMKSMSDRPAGTLNYILVKSVDAAVKKIKANGGKVLVPKQEIQNVGWFACFEVPGGIQHALFQPKGK